MKTFNVQIDITKRISKPALVIILFFQVLLFSYCDNKSNPTTSISKVENITELPERQAFIDNFLKKIKEQKHLEIEGNTVYFSYEGEAEKVSVAGDMNGWKPDQNFLKNITGTNFWYLPMKFESDARLDYKLVVDGKNWIEDPFNPMKTLSGFGTNSTLQMPDYQTPWEIQPNPDSPKGVLQKEVLTSQFTKKKYDLNIYLPPNYSPEKKYPTVYFQDGADYLKLCHAQTVIENLFHKNLVEPFIGVFINPTDRNKEYVLDLKSLYVDFFVKELVPFIDGKFSTLTQANERVVLGDSYGGSISARISFTHPEVFGKSGWHSCALWNDDFELSKKIREMEKQPIKIASVWGKYEENLTEDMRIVNKALKEKGYDIFESKKAATYLILKHTMV